MIATLCLVALMTTTPNAKELRAWGDDLVRQIHQDFYLKRTGQYAESMTSRKTCFNWSTGVWLRALAEAAKRNPSLQSHLDNYLNAAQKYWNPTGPVPGYDVLPMPKNQDRFYDDNAWMVFAMLECGRPDRANAALTYCLSGIDYKLGGGIYWRETPKSSKNTCANAPVIAAALLVDKKHLSTAKSLYDWTRSNLQDSKDSLYWDNISLSGKVDYTKWSYNTGLMIESAALLFTATKEEKYREEAVSMREASLQRWAPEGKLIGPGKFAHLLAEGWVSLANAEGKPMPQKFKNALVKTAQALHEGKDAEGRYPDNWPSHKASGNLIDQASVARLYFLAADALD
ncbi:MAG: glycoside hydrolase family 76 protein [Armatimonadetes bacterium]|nr:glycoside hydrolase family 76 protein [Armatimonadota bacterium]